MKFLITFFLAFILTQTHGFSASRVGIFEPILIVRRANPLVSHPFTMPITAMRSDTFVCSPHILRRHVSLHPSSSLFAVSRRLLNDEKRRNTLEIANPCIDGIFQYGFEEPAVLSDFLNATLEFAGDQSIEDIQYLSKAIPSAIPSTNPRSPLSLSYNFTVDVRCRTKEGRHFLIEMQNDFRDDYHLKCLIEHARMLSRLDTDQNLEDQNRRAKKNKNDRDRFWKGINGLYTIVITNKSFPLSRVKSNYAKEPVMEPLLVNPYELRHIKQLNRRYGDIPNQIVLLMLDNLKKSVEQLSSPIERWAYLFRDSSMRAGSMKIPETREIQDPESIAGEDKAISAFIERIKIKNIPIEVRERYIRALNYYNYSILDIEEKARERGIEQGVQMVAENMLKAKKPINEVMEMTGLSEEQIKGLVKPAS
jgi:hypothetical protein